ncbi:MAG TPA: energy transducer TonB [Pyrinomonadaceae bacterium]|nr:energy transducer TonB [Pyrinomonadaceae bacterium]
MKTKLSLLSYILLALPGLANAQTAKAPEPSQWLRYKVKGEEFSVTLPAEPRMKTSDVFILRLKKSRVERVLEAKVGNVVYRIYVYENPKPRQSLDEFIAEQTASSDLNLTFESNLTAGKFAGKQYSSHDRGLPSTEQFFATEGRFYRFVVRGANADHTEASQFFSSVMLGKKQDGIEVLEGWETPESSGGIGPGPYVGKDVDTKARLISKPEPVYTDRARSNQIIGTVVLKAVFSASGKVTNIRVVQGLPDGLTERAIEAARKIKFIPASKEGKFVSMWMQLEYNFNLY